MKRNKKGLKSLIESFAYAEEGIVHAVCSERNMRIHLLAAILVIFTCMVLEVSLMDMAILTLTIGFVIVCEMVNTAIEIVVDLITESYNEKAKHAKDVAAGAVLFSAFTSVLVAYFVFYEKIILISNAARLDFIQDGEKLLPLSISLVFTSVLLIKGIIAKNFNKIINGISLRAALGFFLLSTSIFLSANRILHIVLLVFAIIFSFSKIDDKKRPLASVIFGALMGIIISVLIFGIMYK